jgi:hypothetical protein
MNRAADGNALLLNRGGRRFADASESSGTAKAGWAWGCLFCDFDDDGRRDLCVANGFMSGRSRADL